MIACMLLQRQKSPESSYKSQVLDCITCDLQQAGGHKNWYCYQCDQLYFAEAPPCSSPMSRRHSGRSQYNDNESLKSPKQEPSEARNAPTTTTPTMNQHSSQEVQNVGSIPQHAPYTYGISESGLSSSFVPFAYNHGIAMPIVDGFEPTEGSASVLVTVYLRSRRDLFLNHGPTPAVIFGMQRVQSRLHPTGHHNDDFYYSLAFWTPWFLAPSSPVLVPLYLTIGDAAQNTLSPMLFGYFAYHAPVGTLGVPPVGNTPVLRRTSSASTPQVSSLDNSTAQNTTWVQSDHSPYMSAHPISTNTGANQYAVPQMVPGGAVSQRSSESNAIKLDSQHESVAGVPKPSARIKEEPISEPFWSTHYVGNASHPPTIHLATPSVMPVKNTDRNQSVSPRSLAVDAPVKSRAPTVKRTMSHSRLDVESGSQHFNPYSFPKATLQIQGDLNDMLHDWTDEEKESRRRLVAFDRSQSGNTIDATFRAIPLANWDVEGICVSCIWWQEKGEAYITSVDMISLLESMVGLRFTLQEKNRIRRNLEGFKPYTIGKSKPDKEPLPQDVEEFFKVIMGLGEPKPRSIEKDVKVFPWRSLATAMKKVVDKYSASYASTAGTLHPMSSLGRPEGVQSARRPSASQSEGASSSADPDF